MRFFFGLVLGGLMTLIVATAFNVPTHTLVDKGKASWDDFLLATGDALFEFPQAPVRTQEPVADQSPTARQESSELPFVEDVASATASVAKDTDTDIDTDIHTEIAPVPLSEPVDLEALLMSETTPDDFQASVLQSAATTATAPVTDWGLGDPDTSTQTVWVPFRSQMSARGFARRLTGKLDHPFSVNREGPGRYQVVFSYANEFERLAVLDQVQSVTGQEAR